MFAASTILYKMLVCLSESRGGSSFGESIFSYCGQRYCPIMYTPECALRSTWERGWLALHYHLVQSNRNE
jgi:hypothetical protein